MEISDNDVEVTNSQMTKNDGVEKIGKNGLNLKLNIKAAVRGGKRSGLREVKSAMVSDLNNEDAEDLTIPVSLTVNEPGKTGKAVKSEKGRNLFLLKTLLPSKGLKRSDEQTDEDGHSRRVHSRSLICSTGGDKYTYDSENVQLPLRSIDIYERQFSLQSAASTSTRTRSYYSGQTEEINERENSLSPVCVRLKFDPMESSSPLDQLHSPDHLTSNPHLPSFYVHRQPPSPSPSPSPSPLPSPTPTPSPSTSSTQRQVADELKTKRDSVIQSDQLDLSTETGSRKRKSSNSWLPFKLANVLKLGGSKEKRNVAEKREVE